MLISGYERRLAKFVATPKNATLLLGQGETKVSQVFDQSQLAAMTTVANVILNLAELLNK